MAANGWRSPLTPPCCAVCRRQGQRALRCAPLPAHPACTLRAPCSRSLAACLPRWRRTTEEAVLATATLQDTQVADLTGARFTGVWPCRAWVAWPESRAGCRPLKAGRASVVVTRPHLVSLALARCCTGDRRLLIKYRPAKKAAVHLRALGLVDDEVRAGLGLHGWGWGLGAGVQTTPAGRPAGATLLGGAWAARGCADARTNRAHLSTPTLRRACPPTTVWSWTATATAPTPRRASGWATLRPPPPPRACTR